MYLRKRGQIPLIFATLVCQYTRSGEDVNCVTRPEHPHASMLGMCVYITLLGISTSSI